MAYDKSIKAGDVADKLLNALRQDQKSIEMDAVIKAKIDQPSFDKAKKQIAELDQDVDVDVDVSKAEQKIKNLMEPLRKVAKEIKSLGSLDVDFKGAHNLVKKYEQLKNAVSEAAQSIGANNQELREAQNIIGSVETAIKGLDITVEKATKKRKARQTKKDIQEIKKQTGAIVEQTDVTKKAASAMESYGDVVDSVSKKVAEQVEVQKKHTENLQKAARAQKELTKAEAKHLKLKPRTEKDGYKISGAYATEDGLFEVDHDADGWKVHRKTASGLYELVGVYKTKNDVQRDAVLIAEQEARAQGKVADAGSKVFDNTPKIIAEVEANQKLTSSYEGLAEAAQKYADACKQWWTITKGGGDASALEAEIKSLAATIAEFFPEEANGVAPENLRENWLATLSNPGAGWSMSAGGAENFIRLMEGKIGDVNKQIEAQKKLDKTAQHVNKTEKKRADIIKAQKERLHEIYEIADKNRGRDLKKDHPVGLDALRKRIDDINTLLPLLRELQAEVIAMDVRADGANFDAAFASSGVLAEAIHNKTRDLEWYSSCLERAIKLEEFAAKAREKYGITTRSKKFGPDVMAQFKEIMVGLENGLTVDDAMSKLDAAMKNSASAIHETSEEVEELIKLLNDIRGGKQRQPDSWRGMLNTFNVDIEQRKKALASLLDMEQKLSQADSSRDDVAKAKQYLNSQKIYARNALLKNIENDLSIGVNDIKNKLMGYAEQEQDVLKIVDAWAAAKEEVRLYNEEQRRALQQKRIEDNVKWFNHDVENWAAGAKDLAAYSELLQKVQNGTLTAIDAFHKFQKAWYHAHPVAIDPARKMVETYAELADILRECEELYDEAQKKRKGAKIPDIGVMNGIRNRILLKQDPDTGRTEGRRFDEDLNSSILDLVNNVLLHGTKASDVLNPIAELMGIKQSSPIANSAAEIAALLQKLHELTGHSVKQCLDMLQRGANISQDAKDILTSLKLLDDSGRFIGRYANDGINNHGVIMNDTHAIIQRDPDYYDSYNNPEDWNFGLKEGETYLDKLIEKMEIAEQRGVSLAKVLSFIQASGSYSNMGYDIQELAPGKSAHIVSPENKNRNIDEFEKECERIVTAKEEHIRKLMSDAIVLNDLGFEIDFGAGNVLYDTERGFTFIDLALRELNVDARTTTELMESLFRCLSGFGAHMEDVSTKMSDGVRYANAMESVLRRLNGVFADYQHVDLNDVNHDFYSYLSDFHNQIGVPINIGFTPSVRSIDEAVESNSDDFVIDDEILLYEEAEEVTKQLGEHIEDAAKKERQFKEEVGAATDAIKEQKTVVEDLSKIVSRDIIDKAMRGVDPEALLSGYGLQGDALTHGVDLFKDLVGATYLGDTSPISADDLSEELINFVMTNAQRTEEVVKVMQDFRERMKLVQIKVAENMERTFEAELGDDWKNTKKLYAIGGNSKNKKRLLTTSKYASAPDTLLEELIGEGFGGVFDQEMMRNYNGAAQDALKILLDAVQRAKDEFKMPNTKTILGLDGAELDSFIVKFTEAMGKVYQNVSAMRPAIDDASVSGDKLADSAERAADATERQAGAERNLLDAVREMEGIRDDNDDSSIPDDEDEEERLRIIQKTVDDALDQLRNAQDNVNRMIDLSAVESPEDLNTQIGNLVQNALGADLHVGGVVVAEDVAQIKLYNQELGITTQQVWRLTKATDDATEARLEFVKADPLSVDFRKARQYAEAQEKALSDGEKSLLGYQKRLDTLTRSYQHGSKTLKGDSNLLLPDATTLQDDADKTLDGLASHIKNRIEAIRENLAGGDRMTKAEQNLFIQDLNALENEIKTMQADTYKQGNMSATEVNELRKSLTAMLETLASKARKNNVFDAISESYTELYNNLNNQSLPGYLTDRNISDAVQRIRTLSKETTKEIQIAGEAKKEQQDLQQLLNLQERLYKAKKNVAELDAQNKSTTSDGMTAQRHASELQAQYDASVKLLENEQQRLSVAERQKQLEEELKTFKAEQQKAQFDRGVKNEEKEQTASVREQYREILGLVNKINAANERMIKFQQMDEGTGALGGKIAEEQAKKLEAVEKLNAVMETLQTTGVLGSDSYTLPDDVKSIGTDYSQIAAFINDVGVQSSLTTAEIEKLVNALVKAGDIDLSMLNAALGSGNMRERIKQTAYENRYFSDKTRASVDAQGSTSLNVEDIRKLGTEGNTAKEKLEGLAQAIAQNSEGAVALTKNFTMGADGIAKLDFSILDTNTGAIKDFTAALGTATGQMGVFDVTVDKSQKNLQAARNKMEAARDVIGRLGFADAQAGDGSTPPQIAKILETIQLLNSEIAKNDGADQNNITKYTKQLDDLVRGVERADSKVRQMEQAITDGIATRANSVDPNGDIYGQLVNEAQRLAQANGGAALELGKFDQATNTLNYSLVNANGTVEQFKMSMYGLNGECATQRVGVGKLTTSWDQFKLTLGQAGKHLMTALVGYNVFYKAISEVRKGISYVKEIDLALTELKKVTDETEESYAKFLKTASGAAGDIGSTVSDFTEASANFARLGYNMSESADMAKTAIVYRNVADGLDTVEEATDSIISTMKAFGIESNNTMGIVDRFNEVGVIVCRL